jgi:hypothetical protein
MHTGLHEHKYTNTECNNLQTCGRFATFLLYVVIPLLLLRKSFHSHTPPVDTIICNILYMTSCPPIRPDPPHGCLRSLSCALPAAPCATPTPFFGQQSKNEWFQAISPWGYVPGNFLVLSTHTTPHTHTLLNETFEFVTHECVISSIRRPASRPQDFELSVVGYTFLTLDCN